VTVVDYNNIEAIATERSQVVPAGRGDVQGRRQFDGPRILESGPRRRDDIRAVAVHAARREDHVPRLEQHRPGRRHDDLHDEQRGQVAHVGGHLHAREQAVHPRRHGARGYPEPGFFQQSIRWLDENGNGIRYQTLYHNGFPKPPTARRRAAVGRVQGQGTRTGRRPGRGGADNGTCMRAIILRGLALAGVVRSRRSRRSTSSSRACRIASRSSFPAQPKITETTYTSEFKSVLPSRVYSVDQGQSHFKVTVVDYNNIQAIATEKAKACPPGAEACSGNTGAASSTGAGYWKPDIEGAVIHATWELMQRPNEKPIYLGWTNMNLVEGHMVNLVNEKDKSRTSAAIYMHENKLYIIEGTCRQAIPFLTFSAVGWLAR
jgi:hypothetical protein